MEAIERQRRLTAAYLSIRIDRKRPDWQFVCVCPAQFTIKPLDKKANVFKFNSSRQRVNKLVSPSRATGRKAAGGEMLTAAVLVCADPPAVHWEPWPVCAPAAVGLAGGAADEDAGPGGAGEEAGADGRNAQADLLDY